MTKIGIFWSGDLGRRAAELLADVLGVVFGAERLFISTKIEPGSTWFEKLRREIAESVAGLFVLTPDALESRWLPTNVGGSWRPTRPTLANGDGQGRPMFYCGKGSDEAPEVFNYYYGLATTAFSQAARLWPTRAASTS